MLQVDSIKLQWPLKFTEVSSTFNELANHSITRSKVPVQRMDKVIITQGKLKKLISIGKCKGLSLDRKSKDLPSSEKLSKVSSIGINLIEIDHKQCVVNLEVSSKIFKDKYGELFNKNNVHLIFDIVNELGIIKIDKENALKHCKVLWIDVTTDIVLKDQEEVRFYINCLKYLVVRKGFQLEPHDHAVEIRAKSKEDDALTTIYNKYAELISGKGRKGGQDPICTFIDPKRFLNILRIEIKFFHHSSIRKFFGLKDDSQLYLTEVFGTTKMVNYDVLDSISLDLAMRYLDIPKRGKYKFNNHEKDIAMDHIITNICNNDHHSLINYLKIYGINSGDDAYRRYINRFNEIKNNELKKEIDIISDLKKMIKADYEK